MTRRSQFYYQSKNAKKRRENALQRSRKGVAAREAKRLANPVEREPKMERFYPLSFAVRDDLTGEVAWAKLKSARDAAKRVGVILREYQLGRKIL